MWEPRKAIFTQKRAGRRPRNSHIDPVTAILTAAIEKAAQFKENNRRTWLLRDVEVWPHYALCRGHTFV